jgi:prolyl 4-hydroxylase
VRYEAEGQQMYEAHWDYFNPNQYRTQPDVVERMDLKRRNRMATLFWYINTLPAGTGGETFFPRALDGEGKSITPWRMDYKDCRQGIKYPPVAGNAVLFYSLRPNGELEEHSMHGGCPVLEGVPLPACLLACLLAHLLLLH